MPRTRNKKERIDESNLVLVGMIKPFAGNTSPDKYLVCDGSTISRTTYAELFAIVGTTWGNGDGSTTFHLPDLRGRFLRGQSDSTGRDPNAGTRTASNSGGASGDAVGSVQGDAARSISNVSFSGSFGGAGGGGYAAGGASSSGVVSAINNSYQGWASAGRSGWGTGWYINYSGDLDGANPQSTENRGINANVKYIIRVEK